MVIIEVSSYSAQWAVEASKCGASRIELCSGIIEGGTTPSIGCIQLVRETIQIDLFVIVRPRGGNFIYDQFEFETMARDIEQLKRIGVDGVVLGILNLENQVDVTRTQQLVALANPMQVTFHRAFDIVTNPYTAMEDIISSGCSRILTSGQKANVFEGLNLLNELKKQSRDRIIILPGSGINEKNIQYLWNETGLKEYHLSAKVKSPNSIITGKSEIDFNISGDNEDYSYHLDVEKLKKVVEMAKKFE